MKSWSLRLILFVQRITISMGLAWIEYPYYELRKKVDAVTIITTSCEFVFNDASYTRLRTTQGKNQSKDKKL